MKRRIVLWMMAMLPAFVSFAEKPLSDEQLRKEFLTWKYGMFICYNVGTFNEREWAGGYEDPASFAPDDLDCGQWIDVAEAAGMKYAVLTVKHTGGWCLWDSACTESHDMQAFTGYKNGKGDIVREFVDACRKRGIKVGLYYCFPGNFTGKAGNPPLQEGQNDLHGLPPEAKGDFAGFIKKQFTELLTNYGKIDLIWVDQYRNKYTCDDWKDIKRHIKSIQPNSIVLANNSLDFDETDIHGYEYPFLKKKRPQRMLPAEDNTAPAEVCDILGPGWFWSSRETADSLRSAGEIADRMKLSNSRNANYLLSIAPDKTGRIPDYSIERLKEIKELMNK